MYLSFSYLVYVLRGSPIHARLRPYHACFRPDVLPWTAMEIKKDPSACISNVTSRQRKLRASEGRSNPQKINKMWIAITKTCKTFSSEACAKRVCRRSCKTMMPMGFARCEGSMRRQAANERQDPFICLRSAGYLSCTADKRTPAQFMGKLFEYKNWI